MCIEIVPYIFKRKEFLMKSVLVLSLPLLPLVMAMVALRITPRAFCRFLKEMS